MRKRGTEGGVGKESKREGERERGRERERMIRASEPRVSFPLRYNRIQKRMKSN